MSSYTDILLMLQVRSQEEGGRDADINHVPPKWFRSVRTFSNFLRLEKFNNFFQACPSQNFVVCLFLFGICILYFCLFFVVNCCPRWSAIDNVLFLLFLVISCFFVFSVTKILENQKSFAVSKQKLELI